MEPSIAIRFLPQFKGADTLLLTCDQMSLETLAQVAHSLASDSETVAVDMQPLARAYGDLSLEAKRSLVDVGIRRTGRQFTWLRSSDGWRAVEELIRSLQSTGTGHQYLDGPSDEVSVMISIGEYPVGEWRHAG